MKMLPVPEAVRGAFVAASPLVSPRCWSISSSSRFSFSIHFDATDWDDDVGDGDSTSTRSKSFSRGGAIGAVTMRGAVPQRRIWLSARKTPFWNALADVGHELGFVLRRRTATRNATTMG